MQKQKLVLYLQRLFNIDITPFLYNKISKLNIYDSKYYLNTSDIVEWLK